MYSGLPSSDFHNLQVTRDWSGAAIGAHNGRNVLYERSWNNNKHYICQFDSW